MIFIFYSLLPLTSENSQMRMNEVIIGGKIFTELFKFASLSRKSEKKYSIIPPRNAPTKAITRVPQNLPKTGFRRIK